MSIQNILFKFVKEEKMLIELVSFNIFNGIKKLKG